MSRKSVQEQCRKCGRRGLLDKELCAICYMDEYGEWSKKFTAGEKGNNQMKFRKSKGGRKK